MYICTNMYIYVQINKVRDVGEWGGLHGWAYSRSHLCGCSMPASSHTVRDVGEWGGLHGWAYSRSRLCGCSRPASSHTVRDVGEWGMGLLSLSSVWLQQAC